MTYVPSYANPHPIFQPAMRVIAGITNTNPIVVTTTFDHQYLDGLIVRLDIPFQLGMQQANQLTGAVLVLSPTTFSMPIDATMFDTFQAPTSFPPQYQDACVVPVGEVNETLDSSTRNVLPFIP